MLVVSEKKEQSGYKKYLVLWLVMIAAYAVWMIFFLRYDTYPLEDTGMLKPVYYVLWTAFSIAYLLLFPLFIKLFLYGKEPGRGLKIFSLVALIFGCVYITWYGFFKNPIEFTASMIGLDYPWHFKMWGLFASLSIFTNVLYMYRKNNYHSTAGVVCGSLGCMAIFVTINVPSAGEELILNSLRCMSHWIGALLFAFLCAASIVIFLLNRCRTKNKRYIALTAVFAAILALMLILLVTVGKNGLIESLPMWAAYLLLFFVNFTGVFDDKKRTAELPEKEPAKV